MKRFFYAILPTCLIFSLFAQNPSSPELVPDGPSRLQCAQALAQSLRMKLHESSVALHNKRENEIFNKCYIHGTKQELYSYALSHAKQERDAEVAIECHSTVQEEKKEWRVRWPNINSLVFMVGGASGVAFAKQIIKIFNG